MLIIFTFLAAPLATAKQPHVPDRKHAAMPNRAAKKVHQPRHVIAVDIWGHSMPLKRLEFTDQLLGQQLIGVQMQLPLIFQWQIFDFAQFR